MATDDNDSGGQQQQQRPDGDDETGGQEIQDFSGQVNEVTDTVNTIETLAQLVIAQLRRRNCACWSPPSRHNRRVR